MTVIDYTDDRMILTFCAKPFEPESSFPVKLTDDITSSDFDNENSINDLYKLQAYDKLLKDFQDINNVNNNNNDDFSSKLFRGKRRITKFDSTKFAYKKMFNHFNKSPGNTKKKHFQKKKAIPAQRNISFKNRGNLLFENNAAVNIRFFDRTCLRSC